MIKNKRLWVQWRQTVSKKKNPYALLSAQQQRNIFIYLSSPEN